jgi:hypothetical protein
MDEPVVAASIDSLSPLEKRVKQLRKDSLEQLAKHAPDSDVRKAARGVIDGTLSHSQFVSLPAVTAMVEDGLTMFRKRLQALTPEAAQGMREEVVRQAQELDVSPYAALADLSRLQEGTGD